jgi:hypothetical protein
MDNMTLVKAHMEDNKVRRARGWRGLRRHHKQRAIRGWSYYDWWNGSAHICEVIGSMAAAYREGHGYPAGSSSEEWNKTLADISEPLLAYALLKDHVSTCEEEKELHDRAQKALHLFADNFSDFWD